MKHFQFKGVLQESGWIETTNITVDEQGKIRKIAASEPSNAQVEHVNGYAIPGFINAHSHAFQYAMAGLAEQLQSADDDFWSWRETMYHLALAIDPTQLEAIAAMLYMEMLRHGYTAVAEFHYLHHDKDGQAYQEQAQMSNALMKAAHATGIKITLVPVYYQKSDFNTPARKEQRRFLSKSVTEYWHLVESCRQASRSYDHAKVGAGIHSLRAATAEDVATIFEQNPADTPLHLHIAEQEQEVRACEAMHGARPVSWLLKNMPVGRNCNLVHATHLTTQETVDLAQSGAVTVLCPSTEGNLGDGYFPLRAYLQAGGELAIGSDSQVGLSPIEELRWLDYGQRMGLRKRNVVCQQQGEDSGALLYRAALMGGRRAVGRERDAFFEVGAPLDALVLDANNPIIKAARPEKRLPTYLYSGDVTANLGTLSNGDWVVHQGRHPQYDEIAGRFNSQLENLRSRH